MEWLKEYADILLLCFTIIGGGFGGNGEDKFKPTEQTLLIK
jgi:hypothetical protein